MLKPTMGDYRLQKNLKLQDPIMLNAQYIQNIFFKFNNFFVHCPLNGYVFFVFLLLFFYKHLLNLSFYFYLLSLRLSLLFLCFWSFFSCV